MHVLVHRQPHERGLVDVDSIAWDLGRMIVRIAWLRLGLFYAEINTLPTWIPLICFQFGIQLVWFLLPPLGVLCWMLTSWTFLRTRTERWVSIPSTEFVRDTAGNLVRLIASKIYLHFHWNVMHISSTYFIIWNSQRTPLGWRVYPR